MQGEKEQVINSVRMPLDKLTEGTSKKRQHQKAMNKNEGLKRLQLISKYEPYLDPDSKELFKKSCLLNIEGSLNVNWIFMLKELLLNY